MKNLLKLSTLAAFCFAMIVFGACGGGSGGGGGQYAVTVTVNGTAYTANGSGSGTFTAYTLHTNNMTYTCTAADINSCSVVK
jgi:hypothetical protein